MVFMTTTVFKKMSLLTLGLACAAGVIFSVGATGSPNSEIKADATITNSKIRIAVVRPVFWDDASAWQVLRIADTSNDLTSNVIANIKYYGIESWVDSGYYSELNGGTSFTEYDTAGIVFYDVPLADINGKYFDLARLSTNDKNTASVWTSTAIETFTTGLNTSLWRIWGNGLGISRPTGTSAESRNIDNAAVGSILYGYLTCSSSASNGYGAYPALRDNFNLGRTFSDTDTLLDYEYFANYSAERTGITVKTGDKVAAMAAAYTASQSVHNIGLLNENKSLEWIIIISLLGLSTTLGTYYVILKKRHLN